MQAGKVTPLSPAPQLSCQHSDCHNFVPNLTVFLSRFYFKITCWQCHIYLYLCNSLTRTSLQSKLFKCATSAVEVLFIITFELIGHIPLKVISLELLLYNFKLYILITWSYYWRELINHLWKFYNRNSYQENLSAWEWKMTQPSKASTWHLKASGMGQLISLLDIYFSFSSLFNFVLICVWWMSEIITSFLRIWTGYLLWCND